jgi:hypothetical protein
MDFKREFRDVLRQVCTVYPGFRVEDYDDEQGDGLIVKRGTASVTRLKDAGEISGNQ